MTNPTECVVCIKCKARLSAPGIPVCSRCDGELVGTRHPEIKVKLTGTDGNAFSLLGRVIYAMRKGGVAPRDVTEFTQEATAGDYDNLLAVCMRWVDVS